MIFPRVCGGFFRISYSEGEVYFQVSTSLTGHWLVLISNYKRDPLTRGNEIMSSKKNSWPDPPYGGSLSRPTSPWSRLATFCAGNLSRKVSRTNCFFSRSKGSISNRSESEQDVKGERADSTGSDKRTSTCIYMCVCENIDRNLFRRKGFFHISLHLKI